MKPKTYIVKREMPFVEVGEEVKTDYEGSLYMLNKFFTQGKVDYLIKHGWIEEKEDWWVPSEDSTFWSINTDFEPVSLINLDGIYDIETSAGNCFKTEKEAEQVAEKIKELIHEHHRGK